MKFQGYPNYPVAVGSGKAPRYGRGSGQVLEMAAGSGAVTYTTAAGTPVMDTQEEQTYHAARTADAAEVTAKGAMIGAVAGILGLLINGTVMYFAVKHGTRAGRR